MLLQEFIDYCTEKKGTTQEFPFDDTTLVFKVMGKMYALINMDPPHSANLKCDPVYAVVLRQKYNSVQPGYHMNKKHWNTVDLEGDATVKDLKEWINDSYNLVVKRLKKDEQARLAKM